MRVIELPLQAGGSVLFEVDDAPKAYRGGVKDAIDTLGVTFDSVIAGLKPMVEGVTHALADLAVAPDSIEIEFEVKLTAEGGLVIAKAGSEASLAIKLGWDRKKPA